MRSSVAERLDSFVTAYEAARHERTGEPDSLRRVREDAFRRFLDRGLPTTRDEEWRFTNVAPIAGAALARARAAAPSHSAIQPFLLPDGPCQIVLVNGRVSRELSSLNRLPAGVTLGSSAHARGPAAATTAFTDLNEALFDDALVMQVAPKAVVTEPIHILSISAGDTPAMVFPRLYVVVGEAAQVSLIESYASTSDTASLTSAVTTFELGPNAVVDHVKFQRESTSAFHLASFAARLERSSTLTSYAITMGGRIARNDIVVTLDGEGAECTLNGLYVASGHSLVDTHTTIDHAKAHCPSHEVYKGILSGHARAVFNGKIIVRQDAQKTDAKQTNKALLLTDDAQINTKPQLEIFADDVKCTHGAAIGQLDEDALFYLRARGIAEADARHLLIEAFAGQILDGIKVPAVREWAETLMERTLSGPRA
jgi:Fe-S cluster assembly protein SufD